GRELCSLVADVCYRRHRGSRPLVNHNNNPTPAGGGQDGRILNQQCHHTATDMCATAIEPTATCKGWPDIGLLAPLGNTYYDSLQAKLTRRFGGSSIIGFSYTWSHAIDSDDNEELGF